MSKQHWQDWVIYFLGLWVLGSPFFLEHSMMSDVPGGALRAMWSLWFTGLGVVILTTAAVEAFKIWQEWASLALGAWLLVSPWVLGFSRTRPLMWNAVIFGALVLVFAGWGLIGGGRSQRAAP